MVIIVRHGEIYTKSMPVRRQFIRRLVQNIQMALPKAEVESRHWRIYVKTNTATAEGRAMKKLKRVFGIISFSPAEECGLSIEAIQRKVKKDFLPAVAKSKSFALSTQRIDKTIKIRSDEVNKKIGQFVKDKTGVKVDLDNPDITLYIELYNDLAYLFTEKIRGPA
ncbi:MAG: THUMP domain-containing protein, partial [Candidatus Micrarchaeota archaeon]